jgi:hypothetical protein
MFRKGGQISIKSGHPIVTEIENENNSPFLGDSPKYQEAA